MTDDGDTAPNSDKISKFSRGALQVAGGAIPVLGGFLSAVAGAWSERDQEKVNRFFEHWIGMIQDEIREKEKTVAEVMARLDLQDEKVTKRLESEEYQSLLKKTFRDWAGAESEDKRRLIRNILANAAASTVSSDDVIRMFLDWISNFSELHFRVIAAIYNAGGITRAEIWTRIGKSTVREDSADADLYKLLMRDLSTGSIVRQHRETDYDGNFVKTRPSRGRNSSSPGLMKSAFDDVEQYELTQLGQQFVHYAMTDLPPKIEFTETATR